MIFKHRLAASLVAVSLCTATTTVVTTPALAAQTQGADDSSQDTSSEIDKAGLESGLGTLGIVLASLAGIVIVADLLYNLINTPGYHTLFKTA